MKAIGLQSESLKTLILHGTSKKILRALPQLGFLPSLETIEIVVPSKRTLSRTTQDDLAKWLMFFPNLVNIKLHCTDCGYILHKVIGRSANVIEKINLVVTRKEELPSYRFDLLFTNLLNCEELKEFTLINYGAQWHQTDILKCLSALQQLPSLKKIKLELGGLTDTHINQLLKSCKTLTNLNVTAPINDNTIDILIARPSIRRLKSCLYPSAVSAGNVYDLLSARDRPENDDMYPINLTLESGSIITGM
ncbi:hypothetical protein V1511DRAFT_446567, partial [Dipodascopsis uninucleata]